VAKLAPQAVPPVRWAVDARRLPASVVEELRDLLKDYPGEAEFVLEMHTADGLRRLRFGDAYKVARHAGLKAELEQLLGGARPSPPAREPEPVMA
jgi:DNA polymerase III subunit alpha